MRKIYLSILLCLCVSFGYAQITGADTVCRGTTVTYSNANAADNYAWVLDTVNTMQTSINGAAIIDLKAYGAPYGLSMVFDNSNSSYHAFVTMRLGNILRLDFGSNPYSVPSINNLGSFSILGDSTHGIDIVQDGTNWYGFVVSNDKLVRLDFGTSITNSPTATSMKFAANLDYAYQITIKKYGNEWLGFAINRASASITRFDFGTSLTSTPSPTNFGNNFQLSRPTGFSLYKENNNWFLIATNIGSGGGPGGGGQGISRFEFGTNLKNNIPTGTNLGRIGNKLSGPRAISMIADCDKIFALISNDNQRLIQIDFNGSISNPASSFIGTDLGKLSLGNNFEMQSFSPFWYSGRLSLLATSFGDSVLYMYDNVYTMPTNSQVSYSQSTFVKTMNIGGTIPVTLHANQGSARGPEAVCSKTYVINTLQVAIVQNKDTMIASGTLCDVYVWKLNGVVIPGATSQTYVTDVKGIYTVTGSKANCSATSNYYFVPSGVNTVAYDKFVQVYPNPSTDIFNIDIQGLSTDRKVNIYCYNVLGAMVATQSFETANGNGKTIIDLKNFPRGVYQLRIQAEGESNLIRQIILE